MHYRWRAHGTRLIGIKVLIGYRVRDVGNGPRSALPAALVPTTHTHSKQAAGKQQKGGRLGNIHPDRKAVNALQNRIGPGNGSEGAIQLHRTVAFLAADSVRIVQAGIERADPGAEGERSVLGGGSGGLNGERLTSVEDESRLGAGD